MGTHPHRLTIMDGETICAMRDLIADTDFREG